jgi:hypothetical protein
VLSASFADYPIFQYVVPEGGDSGSSSSVSTDWRPWMSSVYCGRSAPAPKAAPRVNQRHRAPMNAQGASSVPSNRGTREHNSSGGDGRAIAGRGGCRIRGCERGQPDMGRIVGERGLEALMIWLPRAVRVYFAIAR